MRRPDTYAGDQNKGHTRPDGTATALAMLLHEMRLCKHGASLRLVACVCPDSQQVEHGRTVALGEFVATIFATNSSILGGVMSKINRDK